MVERFVPPARWLFADRDKRRTAMRYWLRDTIVGSVNTLLHESLRRLSVDGCSRVGAEIVRVTRHAYPDSDRRARALWRAFNAGTGAEEDRAMEKLWRNVSRTMTEYSVLDRLWREGRISVAGLEHANAARAAGKPILFAGLHLGNWETIGVTLVATGYAGSGFYEPPTNRFDDAIARKVRLRYGAKIVFPEHSAGRTAYRVLADNTEVFLIYVDEMFQGRVAAPALGRNLRPEGNIAHVARLARLTGAAVIPIYCLRENDNARFAVTFLPEVTIEKTPDKEADLIANVTRIHAAIEPAVRANINQWYYALDFEPDA